MDISEFMNWFIQQVVNIGKGAINILDNIIILILAIPQNAMNKAEKSIRESKKKERNSK